MTALSLFYNIQVNFSGHFRSDTVPIDYQHNITIYIKLYIEKTKNDLDVFLLRVTVYIRNTIFMTKKLITSL